MTLVLDCSFVINLFAKDNDTEISESGIITLKKDSNEGIVPSFWWFEVGNVLMMKGRAGKCTLPQARSFLDYLSQFPIR